MLVILSDTHHSDGTTSTNPSPESFTLLRETILDRARARHARELRVLLLGDILDLVRTDWWLTLPPETRPWNGTIDPHTGMNRNLPEVERQFLTVIDRVLDTPSTASFLRELQRLARSKSIPRFGIDYVPGNHDRALHNFPSLQERIRSRLPGIEVRFHAHYLDPAHGVAARHGHEWDEHNNARLLLQYVLQRRRKWPPLDPGIHPVMSIGEVVTAELMSGLVHRVRQTGNAALAETIKGVDNLRPATRVFEWLQWQTRGRHLTDPESTLLCQALIDSISGVVDSSLGRLWDHINPDVLISGDLIDRLQLVRSTLRLQGLGGLRHCVRLFGALGRLKQGLLPATDENLEGARSEAAALPPECQFLVQGHTHVARHDYLSATVEGRVRLYINTGTYLPLIQGTEDGQGFAGSHQMTMAFFYRGDEGSRPGGGPTLDLWNGIKRKE